MLLFLSDPQFNIKSSFYFMLFLCDQKVLKESFACKIHLFCIILFSYRNVYFNNRFLKLSPVQQRKGHLDFITFSSFFRAFVTTVERSLFPPPPFPREPPPPPLPPPCAMQPPGEEVRQREREKEKTPGWSVWRENDLQRPPPLLPPPRIQSRRGRRRRRRRRFLRAPVSRIFRNFECFSALRAVRFK